MIQVTTFPHRHPTPLGFVWRSLLASAGFIVALALGGMLASVLGLPASDMASKLDMSQLLVGMFVGGILISVTVGALATKLAVPQVARVSILFSLLLILNSVLNVLESLFFTTLAHEGQLAGIVTQAVGYLALAVLLAWLFPSDEMPRPLRIVVRETWEQRSSLAWLGRLVLAGLLYIPTYWTFGMLIAPIVLPYYNNPALGLGLVVPEPGTILALEAMRGLLFVLAVFPVVLVWRDSRLSLAVWLGLTIAVLAGIAPMVQGTFLPVLLRLVHGAEITVDSLVHGLLIAWLLGVGAWRKG